MQPLGTFPVRFAMSGVVGAQFLGKVGAKIFWKTHCGGPGTSGVRVMKIQC